MKIWIKRIVVVMAIIGCAIGVIYNHIKNAATYLRLEPEELVFGKCGGSEIVNIDYDGYIWQINYAPDWMSATQSDNNTIQVVCSRNLTGKIRQGMVTICSGKQIAQLVVKQQCVATYLRVSEDKIVFDKNGSSKYISLDTDGTNWDLEAPDYLRIIDGFDGFSVKADANEGIYRSGKIILRMDGMSRYIYFTQGGLCPVCKGAGECSCIFCGGSGGTWFGMSYIQCGLCHGAGKFQCATCQGSGYKE